MVAAMYKHLRSNIPDCVSMFHASLADETLKFIQNLQVALPNFAVSFR